MRLPLRFFLMCTCMLASNLLSAQVLQGFVIDNESREHLAYASIGVKNKNIGGIADRNGAFSIDLSGVQASDSIVFSHIGYESVVLSTQHLDVSKNLEIKLKSAPQALADFVVTAKFNMLNLGITKHSGRFTGWGDYSSSRGRARGILVQPLEFPLRVTEFICRIKYNSFDSVKIRINMFKKPADGSQLQQMLQNNIYYTIPKNARTVRVDLSPYNIVITDTIILAVEWIDAWTDRKSTDENPLFTISLGRANGFCYERNTPNEQPSLKSCSEMPAMYLRGYRAGKKY
ncbi:MAG: carboxypeptidase-like regulatory domain-containing protein [Chitinophagaceae bacterium]|nr:carboxypeptidase-like regulatory domain-containing protein [Chitinophagaceae bacterium]